MSHQSKLFTSTPIDIPNRSGFNMSHENMLTMKCGTLIPILTEEIMPNETVSLGHLSQVTLPPMATNFYGRIDLRIEAFFVPMRILWGGWQNFFTMPFNNPYSNSVVRPTSTPSFTISANADNTILGPGTLADYLGFKITSELASSISSTNSITIPNVLPFIAYHRIWDAWYRNKNIQNPAFVNVVSGTSSPTNSMGMLPWSSTSSPSLSTLSDGKTVWSLRQRNFAKDYFTTAALYPQASGDVVGSSVDFTVADSSGSISIPALRSANVLQRWMDRNNVAGPEYADQIKAHYGVMPSDAITQRPIFLGSDIVGVYNRSVYSQSQNSVSDSRNPYIGNVGSFGASSQGFKDGSLIGEFKATEHGYIMVLASIVPHAQYSTGIRRQLLHSVRGDFPIPLLQGLGEQPIYNCEINGAFSSGSFDKTVFGYQQQYSENKYHDDEVHGLLSDGENLSAFALQRSFPSSSPVLSSSFLEIPTDFLDQVQAVDTSTSGYSAWLDVYLSLNKVSPLSEYVIPTLGDLKNTHKESVPYRGRQL